ncbi:MAG: hypothetical protein AB7D05_03915 [Mangrovibacterium sp.]
MMYRLIVVFFVLMISENLHAQKSRGSDRAYRPGEVYAGLSSGVDFHFSAFREISTSSYNFEEKGPRYNIGIDLGVMATERLRPRLELKYVRLAYGQEWTGWEDASYGSFKYTTTKVSYLDLNLHFDFLLLGKYRKLNVFLSPGLKTEYATGTGYKSIKTDGDTTTDSYSQLGDYYPKSIAGAAFSVIFKYRLSNRLGLTLTPEYTRFFRKFQRVNTEQYERFSLNLGLEFRVH